MTRLEVPFFYLWLQHHQSAIHVIKGYVKLAVNVLTQLINLWIGTENILYDRKDTIG